MRSTEYVSEALRLLRGEAGLKQAELADRMGISRTSLTRFENRPTSIEFLGRYLDALGVGLFELAQADQRIKRARHEGGTLALADDDPELVEELRAENELRDLQRQIRRSQMQLEQLMNKVVEERAKMRRRSAPQSQALLHYFDRLTDDQKEEVGEVILRGLRGEDE